MIYYTNSYFAHLKLTFIWILGTIIMFCTVDLWRADGGVCVQQACHVSQ